MMNEFLDLCSEEKASTGSERQGVAATYFANVAFAFCSVASFSTFTPDFDLSI
jgi:hypothetical protein